MSSASGIAEPPAALIRRAWEEMYIDNAVSVLCAERALAFTQSEPTHPCRGEAWFHVALARLRGGRHEEGRQAVEAARAAFQNDARGLLLCDEIDAFCLRLAGDPQSALTMQLRIAHRTDVQRQPMDYFLSHNWRAFTRKHLGQADHTLRDFYQARMAAEAVDHPGPRLTALVNLGVTHKDLFNLEEARDLLERGLDQAEAAQAWNAFGIAAAHLLYTYEGLSLSDECAALLQRLSLHEHRLPTGLLDQNAPALAIGHLGAGDMAAARRWLRKGAVASFGDGDGRTDFTRAAADYLIRCGRYSRARRLVDRRMAQIERMDLRDPPYARMRLLRAGSTACERSSDVTAALIYMHRAHDLFESLVAKNADARFIALQASHELVSATAERDGARLAQSQAEKHAAEVLVLNRALQERIEESTVLAGALRDKVAEAEALQQVLREQAIRDPLTGLFNRRFLSEIGPGRVATAQRRNVSLAVVLLDIDHFKRVNDNHGHALGDAVLTCFAGLLRARFRISDTVSRFGGEEFLVLAEDCAEIDLLGALKELQRRLSEESFGCGAAAFGGLTFSAGIAMLGGDGDSFDTLAKVADDRMYVAKAAGRARVVGCDGQLP